MKIYDENNLVYLKHGIYSVNSLAKALNLDVEFLISVLGNDMNELYRRIEKRKSDNSVRICYEAIEPLKMIQAKIVKTFFKKAFKFPSYLTGSISGCDFKKNAAMHLGARVVIKEDISSFFPSTKQELVLDIWQNIFKFSKEVSAILTTLTTLNNQLPQGASTSSYLANMVFFRHEPGLVRYCIQRSLVYSRYVDDICVSAITELTDEEKTEIIAKIYGMMRDHGYSPKRPKHEILTSKNPMHITGLNINSGNLSMLNESRKQIRAAIHNFNKNPPINKKAFDCKFNSLLGKANHIKQFHKNEGEKMIMQLQKTKRPDVSVK